MSSDCFICQKHAGMVAPPPGGYCYADPYWKVCHAPAPMGGVGTILIETTRHVLDFGEMTSSELTSYGPLLQRLYRAIKRLQGAERVYAVVLLEGVAHFHAWLVPRWPDSPERGMTLLTQDSHCTEEDAAAFAQQLRAVLHDTRP